MNNNICIIIYLIFTLFTNCSYNNSKNTNFTKEIVTIEDSIKKENSTYNNRSNYFKEIPFYKELLSKLNNKKDTMYIRPRNSLEKFSSVIVSDNLARFKHKQYEVIISSENFDKNCHSLDLVDTIWKSNGTVDYLKTKNIIDGRKAYGIDGTIPDKKISEIIVKNDIEAITINQKFFNDIFNVNLKKTETYFVPDQDVIFIYLSGSDAAGSYSAKYVVSHKGYITRIIAEFCGFDFIDGINYDCI